MEQRAVGTSADLVDYTGLEINVKRPGDVLAAAGSREEGRESLVSVRWRVLSKTTIGLRDWLAPECIEKATPGLTEIPCSVV